MARFTILVLVLSIFPAGLAGPACAYKHHQTPGCVQKCRTRWGWKDHMMNTDPWGSVVHDIGDSSQIWDSIIEKACGSTVPSLPDVTSSLATIVIQTTSPPAVVSTSSVPHGSAPPASESPSVISTPSSAISSGSQMTPAASPAATDTPKATAAPTTTRFVTSVRVFTTEKPTTDKAQQPSVTDAPPPPSSSPASSPSNSGSTSPSDIQAYLTSHNTIRGDHGAAPLAWSDELASKAQQWANGCKFQHSGGSLGPYGENLAAGTGSSYGITEAVKSWTDEASDYNSNNPQPSHFTQVVWKGSKQVGCAVQECNGIFSAQYGKAKYFVCEYSPAGNVIGRFPENVQA